VKNYTYFNNQLNAQILLFYNNMYDTLQSSTCFEHQHAHLQKDKLLFIEISLYYDVRSEKYQIVKN